MTLQVDNLIKKMRATNIPAGQSGLWSVRKETIKEPRWGMRNGKKTQIVPGDYTYLARITLEKMNKIPPGEIVMEDTLEEMKSHLEAVFRAHGNVLVSGLGLGCVIRGMLENPRVEKITCIERSKHVLNLVAPHMAKDRLEIVHADIFDWIEKNRNLKFDYGYHDLWSDPDRNEPSLQKIHGIVIMLCRGFVKNQGAWQLSKCIKAFLIKKQVIF